MVGNYFGIRAIIVIRIAMDGCWVTAVSSDSLCGGGSGSWYNVCRQRAHFVRIQRVSARGGHVLVEAQQ
jgi:hypothetical protein